MFDKGQKQSSTLSCDSSYFACSNAIYNMNTSYYIFLVLDKIIADFTPENIFSSPAFCQMFALQYAFTTDSHKSIDDYLKLEFYYNY